MTEEQAETGAPSRPVLVAAGVLALALVAVVAVFGLLFTGSEEQQEGGGPLALSSVPAPQSDTPHCAQLVQALPATLESSAETLDRRQLAEPAPPATVAWGEPRPVVLRCGLDRPAELTRTSQLRVVNDVRWLPVPGTGSTTWYVVDRDVYVGLTVPDGTGTGALQAVSDTVSATLEPVPLRFE